MRDLTYDNFAEALRTSVPGFDRVYDEHVADYDEVCHMCSLANSFGSCQAKLHYMARDAPR